LPSVVSAVLLYIYAWEVLNKKYSCIVYGQREYNGTAVFWIFDKHYLKA
jgi:hypothetical protein